MGIEGQIKIHLHYLNGRVEDVDIESSRPVHASRIFHGKTINQANMMIPLLFSVCGTAHMCAATRASENASGTCASNELEQLRDSLVAVETLREHLLRIFFDWPDFIGEKINRHSMSEMISLEKLYRQAICVNGNLFGVNHASCRRDPDHLKAVTTEIAEMLNQNVFAMHPKQWLEISSVKALTEWAQSTPTVAATLINMIIGQGWSKSGACLFEMLPQMEHDVLQASLDDENFVKAPHWFGDNCENTYLNRVDTPLLTAMKLQFDNGLLTRITALLSEVAQISVRLLSEPLENDSQGSPATKKENPAIGQSAAARGQLVHRIRFNGSLISRYQILAPTEWNFHPEGVVAKSLGTLSGDRHDVEAQAHLIIKVIDPCVSYDLTISEE